MGEPWCCELRVIQPGNAAETNGASGDLHVCKQAPNVGGARLRKWFHARNVVHAAALADYTKAVLMRRVAALLLECANDGQFDFARVILAAAHKRRQQLPLVVRQSTENEARPDPNMEEYQSWIWALRVDAPAPFSMILLV